jgi:hypothetical protein
MADSTQPDTKTQELFRVVIQEISFAKVNDHIKCGR